MGILSKTGPGIVYLDQCALGELFRCDPRPDWLEVLRLLRLGVESGRIILPLSAEHLLETAGSSNLAMAELRRRQMLELTKCTMFIPPEAAVARHLLAAVRRKVIDRADVLGKLSPEFIVKPMSVLSERKKLADADFANQTLLINSIVKPRGIVSKDDRNFMEEMHEKHARNTFERIIKAMNVSAVVGELRHLLDHYCHLNMRFETTIVNEILALDPTPSEVAVLRFRLEVGRDSDVPILDVARELSFNANLKQLRRERGDFYDVSRLQVAVPYSDIVITDGKQRAAIKERRLDRRYATKVFSCSPGEDRAIIAAIEGLLS